MLAARRSQSCATGALVRVRREAGLYAIQPDTGVRTPHVTAESAARAGTRRARSTCSAHPSRSDSRSQKPQPRSGASPQVNPVINVGTRRKFGLGHRRQFSYLFLGEVEADAGVDPSHGADGDGDFLAAPQMPLLEQYVGHLVIALVDQEALHPPDLTIDGVDPFPRPHLVLTRRKNVFCECGPPFHAPGAGQAVMP